MEVVVVGIAVEDLLVYLILVLAVERRDSCQHFIEHTSKAPPVASLAIALLLDDFRSQVLSCSTKAGCLRIRREVVLGEAKVCEDSESLFINQNVLRLQTKREGLGGDQER
jgi:hypothetical protein